MKRKELRWLMTVLLPCLIATAAYAGGWAIVTVTDLPECVVSGSPVILTFTVRQHGITLLDGLKPRVRATAAGRRDTKAVAAPTANRGEYSATLVFPEAGEWTMRIDSGFNSNASTLLPLTVIRPGSPSPLPLEACFHYSDRLLAQAERGERLFVAKGCVGCHRHQEVAAATLASVGPDLTGKRFAPDYLKEFLADPRNVFEKCEHASSRPAPPAKNGQNSCSSTLQYGQMPNLNLKEAEIAALVSFITQDDRPDRAGCTDDFRAVHPAPSHRFP